MRKTCAQTKERGGITFTHMASFMHTPVHGSFFLANNFTPMGITRRFVHVFYSAVSTHSFAIFNLLRDRFYPSSTHPTVTATFYIKGKVEV